MNRYEKKNAADKIDGYCLPGKAFEEARAECLKHLLRQLKTVKELSEKDFLDQPMN